MALWVLDFSAPNPIRIAGKSLTLSGSQFAFLLSGHNATCHRLNHVLQNRSVEVLTPKYLTT